MKINFPSLYVEINLLRFIFIISDKNKDDNDDYKIIHINSPAKGIKDHQFTDLDLA